MASRKPSRKIVVSQDAYHEHLKDMRKTKVSITNDFERPAENRLQWKIDERAIYTGTPHRMIRSQHGDAAVLILEVLSDTEVVIMVEGVTMTVHPRELRPLDYET